MAVFPGALTAVFFIAGNRETAEGRTTGPEALNTVMALGATFCARADRGTGRNRDIQDPHGHREGEGGLEEKTV